MQEISVYCTLFLTFVSCRTPVTCTERRVGHFRMKEFVDILYATLGKTPGINLKRKSHHKRSSNAQGRGD